MTRSQRIKELIPLSMALEYYGVKYNGGRIPCPIHQGKHNNFSIKNNIYTCFSQCGTGSVIDFVMLMESTDFKHAVDILDKRYNLCLQDIKSSREQIIRQKENREKIARLKNSIDKLYNKFCYYSRLFEGIIAKERPSSFDNMSGIYLLALQEHTTLNHYLDSLFFNRLNVLNEEKFRDILFYFNDGKKYLKRLEDKINEYR